VDRNNDGKITRAEVIKTVKVDERVRQALGLPQKIGEEQRAELEDVFQGTLTPRNSCVYLCFSGPFLDRSVPSEKAWIPMIRGASIVWSLQSSCKEDFLRTNH
jgi:hypothetical protein